jgi:hypothetical protein
MDWQVKSDVRLPRLAELDEPERSEFSSWLDDTNLPRPDGHTYYPAQLRRFRIEKRRQWNAKII